MSKALTAINYISDEIIDYYLGQRDDSGFRFSRKWVNECVDERAGYYELDANQKNELSNLIHSFFKQHFEQYKMTHNGVTQYLEEQCL